MPRAGCSPPAPAARSADRVRARPRLEGLEDRCLLSIIEYPTPTVGSSPYGIATGPDGNLWFTERAVSPTGSVEIGKIGMINPNDPTHTINEFTFPAATDPVNITAGSDGNLWFTEWNGKIGKINPTTHTITEYPVPSTKRTSATPAGITSGPDGNLWFTDNTLNVVGKINPTTLDIVEFPIPTAGSHTQNITAGPDGNLWFTEVIGNKIGMINPNDPTHTISEFTIPSSPSPQGITAGPDGNLWFGENSGNSVGMINPTTHVISEFAISSGHGPYKIAAGPDGNIWFGEGGTSVHPVGMINPTTHALTEYPIPYANGQAYGITSGPDGNIWFADPNTGAIGAYYFQNLVVTTQPPASLTAGSSFGLTVQAQDSSGNLLTSFNGPVTVGLFNNPGGATLGGTLTVTASGGVATFSDLTLTRAASGYTLTTTTPGLGQGITNAMTVTPAAATQLVFTQQPPSTVKVSTAFTMKAAIADAYGNVVTTASGTVSVAIANNPTGATLGGTLTVTASAGVASFTNLTINKTGTGYTLRVTSGSLASATSNPINVTQNGQAPSALFASTSAGTTASDLSLAPLVLDSPDLWDVVLFKKRARSS